MKNILLLAGDFTEDYEVMVPYQALEMLGIGVDVVCPGKRSGEFIKTAIHEDGGDQTYAERPGHRFRLTGSFFGAEPENYAGLYLAGGRAPEYLRLNAKVLHLVRHFMNRALPVAAICHGVQILTAAGAVLGKKLTAYPAIRPEVEMAGGTFIDVEPGGAVTDGNLVTAQDWMAHPAILRGFTSLLGVRVQH